MTEQEEYEAILDVFASDGWKLIQKDMQDTLQAVESINGINSVEELFKRKGEAERLRWFIDLEAYYEYAKTL